MILRCWNNYYSFQLLLRCSGKAFLGHRALYHTQTLLASERKDGIHMWMELYLSFGASLREKGVYKHVYRWYNTTVIRRYLYSRKRKRQRKRFFFGSIPLGISDQSKSTGGLGIEVGIRAKLRHYWERI